MTDIKVFQLLESRGWSISARTENAVMLTNKQSDLFVYVYDTNYDMLLLVKDGVFTNVQISEDIITNILNALDTAMLIRRVVRRKRLRRVYTYTLRFILRMLLVCSIVLPLIHWYISPELTVMQIFRAFWYVPLVQIGLFVVYVMFNETKDF